MSVSPIVIKVGGALLDDTAAMTRLFLSVKDVQATRPVTVCPHAAAINILQVAYDFWYAVCDIYRQGHVSGISCRSMDGMVS